jgi:hypothetical protein
MAGLFDEWLFVHAGVEDLDVGLRLYRAGHRVKLAQNVTVSHVARERIRGVLGMACRRASLTARCLGFRATRALARSHPVHVLTSSGALAGLALSAAGVGIAAATAAPWYAWVAGALVPLLVANAPILGFITHRRGITMGIASAPIHVGAQIAAVIGLIHGWLLRGTIGDPAPDAATQAFAEVGVSVWPPVPAKRDS